MAGVRMGSFYWKLWVLSVAVGGALALVFQWTFAQTDWQLALPAIVTIALILSFVILRITGEREK